jgi:hypothetical protein
MPSRRSRSTKKVRGGSAWQYAASVYGNANSQHPIPGSGNLIATNNASGGLQNGGGAVVAKNGGNGITQVAVPGVLLIANQMKNGRSRLFSRSKRFRRSRKSRRFRKSRR